MFYFSNGPRIPPLKFTTPPNVGPFTYMLDDPLDIKRVNIVPFLSSDKRDPDPKKLYTEAIYDVNNVPYKIVGGSSMQATAKRFDYKSENGPGPASYEKSTSKAWAAPRRTKKKSGKLYFCKVPYSVLGSSPSIPTKADSNGYSIDPDGKLIKNRPTSVPKEPHPQTYKVCDFDESPYKGNYWSRRTAKRDIGRRDDMPGPGSYNVAAKSISPHLRRQEEFREMARILTYLPRFLDEQQLKTMRKNVPAPNKYRIPPSDFDNRPVVTCITKPFISDAPRFVYDVTSAPPPTRYDVGGDFGSELRVPLIPVPFTYAAERLTGHKIHKTPGPGDYDIIGKSKKPSKQSGHFAQSRASFGTTMSRQIDFVQHDAKTHPPSTTYPRERLLEHSVHPSSVFASATGRFEKKSFYVQGPSPSSYDTIKAFKKNRDSTSHQKKKMSFVFHSEAELFGKVDGETPGPADYLGACDMGEKGYYFERSERFKEPTFNTPPPDHYFIHPSHVDSVFKTRETHNLRIAESILKKKLRLPAKDTYQNFKRILKARKKLRCFNPVQ